MKEIIVNKTEDGQMILLLENGIILEKYAETENQERLEGNIYIGKVENVLQGMQAAFVDIGEKKNTFIHLKDVLPKMDEAKMDIDEIMKSKNIKDVVKPGMPIMVQVKRDANLKKGARVSTHISLASRYFVFMPNTNFITISRKIDAPEEKERITEIIKNRIPQNCGAIIRTSAKGKTKEELEKDLDDVVALWDTILEKSSHLEECPRRIYQNPGIMEKLITDVVDQDVGRITVNDEEIYRASKRDDWCYELSN